MNAQTIIDVIIIAFTFVGITMFTAGEYVYYRERKRWRK